MSIQQRKLSDSIDPGKIHIRVLKIVFFLLIGACFLPFFTVTEQSVAAEDCECKVCHGPAGPHGSGFQAACYAPWRSPTSSSGLIWYPSPLEQRARVPMLSMQLHRATTIPATPVIIMACLLPWLPRIHRSCRWASPCLQAMRPTTDVH
jgi:hypothetical protein